MASKIDKTRVDLTVYQTPDTDFAHLSLRDLMDARDLYHIQLMRYENVVATAVGRYRIRHSDSWPNERPARHSTGVRTLTNSEVRPYSWPAILVFVSQWESRESLTTNSDELVPTTLYLPDGRRVPVCVIEAPRESKTEIAAPDVKLPVNNIGPGYPVVARVQGQTYLATVGCLVSDGHKIFALTNKHVTGDSQEEIFARSGASDRRVGVSVAKQLGRLPFTTVYPSFAGRDTFVNLDFGLIEIDEIDQWTTKVRGIGVVGQMADFSDVNLTLSLIGCRLRAVGAASGDMRGEIAGLFYRYKKSGGFEYVADLLIGPRSTGRAERGKSNQPAPDFRTLPGDSGAMWMLEPAEEHSNGGKKTQGSNEGDFAGSSPARHPMGAPNAALSRARRAARIRFGDFDVASLRAARRRSRARLEFGSNRHLGSDRSLLDRSAQSGRAVQPSSQAGQIDEGQRRHYQPQRR